MPIRVSVPALDMLLDMQKSGTEEVQQAAGEAVMDLVSSWLFELDQTHPNALGGDRTHFWLHAAETMKLETDDKGATITINRIGFAQRLYGGDIHAVNVKFLTIPARAEYYAHRAGEFDDLHFILFGSGTAALVEDDTGMVAYWLKESVHQEPDPTVLPTTEDMVEAAGQGVARWWMKQLQS